MPIALIALAWLLVMTGINGNFTAVGQQFEQDVMGSGGSGTGFLNFLVGMIGIAAFFRLIGMPNAGKVFLTLVLLVFVLKNANVLTALENIGGSSATTGSAPGTATASGAQPASSTATSSPGDFAAGGTPVANATPLTTPAPGTGTGGIGSA